MPGACERGPFGAHVSCDIIVSTVASIEASPTWRGTIAVRGSPSPSTRPIRSGRSHFDTLFGDPLAASPRFASVVSRASTIPDPQERHSTTFRRRTGRLAIGRRGNAGFMKRALRRSDFGRFEPRSDTEVHVCEPSCSSGRLGAVLTLWRLSWRPLRRRAEIAERLAQPVSLAMSCPVARAAEWRAFSHVARRISPPWRWRAHARWTAS
jgi:hypothetical protein